ncbi:MAG: tRNA pseudouridine(38-40) synthase TruA [Arcobacteraceae bacterium]|nr:tRNA pseudouridine(38-40) synthase TruA [Arcobacteraceae bacterium]
MTIKLTISYDGSKFNGSQKQPNTITVQGELDNSLKQLGINSKTNFSGRTDKDVHASSQVVSCTIPTYWNDLNKLKSKLNHILHNSIKIKSIIEVDNNFHARFSAKKRSYRYIISKNRLTAFNCNYMHFKKDIDIKLLKKISSLFIGVHDFEYFSKKGSEPISTIREIYSIKIYEYKDLIVINFNANSYLRSQIRMIVDFLLKISDNKLTLEDLKNQLNKKKLVSWTLAPPNGLYLSRINY